MGSQYRVSLLTYVQPCCSKTVSFEYFMVFRFQLQGGGPFFMLVCIQKYLKPIWKLFSSMKIITHQFLAQLSKTVGFDYFVVFRFYIQGKGPFFHAGMYLKIIKDLISSKKSLHTNFQPNWSKTVDFEISWFSDFTYKLEVPFFILICT